MHGDGSVRQFRFLARDALDRICCGNRGGRPRAAHPGRSARARSRGRPGQPREAREGRQEEHGRHGAAMAGDPPPWSRAAATGTRAVPARGGGAIEPFTVPRQTWLTSSAIATARTIVVVPSPASSNGKSRKRIEPGSARASATIPGTERAAAIGADPRNESLLSRQTQKPYPGLYGPDQGGHRHDRLEREAASQENSARCGHDPTEQRRVRKHGHENAPEGRAACRLAHGRGRRRERLGGSPPCPAEPGRHENVNGTGDREVEESREDERTAPAERLDRDVHHGKEDGAREAGHECGDRDRPPVGRNRRSGE